MYIKLLFPTKNDEYFVKKIFKKVFKRLKIIPFQRIFM